MKAAESRFKDRVALVTGSTRGIGRAIAGRFIKEGVRVIVSGTNPEAVGRVKAELGDRSIGVCADVRSEKDVKRLVDEGVDAFGRIDIVVNNAGITRDSLVLRMDSENWDIVLDINLRGAFLVTKAVSRIMMKQRYGRIINISSVIGLSGNPGQANYAASKAGLIGLTKSVARELAGRNVTANAVAPGFIETDMTADMPSQAREALIERSAIARPGTVDDVAAAVLFLASDEASFITGQVITVDGGMTM